MSPCVSVASPPVGGEPVTANKRIRILLPTIQSHLLNSSSESANWWRTPRPSISGFEFCYQLLQSHLLNSSSESANWRRTPCPLISGFEFCYQLLQSHLLNSSSESASWRRTPCPSISGFESLYCYLLLSAKLCSENGS